MTNAETRTQTHESGNRSLPFNVVVGTDLSELGDRAVLEALRICDKYEPSELHVLSVADDQLVDVRLPGQDIGRSAKEAETFLCRRVGKLVDQYRASGNALAIERVAVYVTTGSPAERIVSLAQSVDAELIVIGTHGRSGLKRALVGSVAEEVVRRAPCGVFVIRPRDFLDGQKVPDVQPPLRPGERSLQPFRHGATYHYVDRAAQVTQRIMPAI
jgi:nucleotide-binding universal stress UspA family protein